MGADRHDKNCNNLAFRITKNAIMDDLRPIRVFLQVAEKRSFAAAAREMSLTPASVTRLVARLEQDLGQQLFLRTTRQVALTAEGAAVVARFRDLLAEFDQARQAIAQARRPDQGRIRVTAPISFALRLMPGIIDAFRVAYPLAQVQITLNDRLEDVMQGEHDLAIRISDPPRDKTTIWRRICAVPRSVVAAPALFDRMPRPVRPQDLDPAICLAYGAGSEMWRFRQGSRQVSITAGQGISANNGDLLLDLACRGAGAALLPDFISDAALRDGRLERVLPEWSVPGLWLSLTYPGFEVLPPLVATFSDFFEAALRDAGGLDFTPAQGRAGGS
jgi:DNA-binding transcriptional LysR family regulator